MYSFGCLILAIFVACRLVTSQQFLEAKFYNPPKGNGNSPTSSTPASTIVDIEQSTPSFLPAAVSASPTGAIACVPPIETYTLTHAAISACPRCAPSDRIISSNQSAQETPNSLQGTIESVKVTFLNPSSTAGDISCRLTWDTSIASPNKFPIAKQMDCDHNEYNQLNAVVEKQASGAAAGFYLFVWNNNQVETMVAWMVGNISPTNRTRDGWKNGTLGIHERLYHEGYVELDSMPTMKLTDWLQITANATD